MDKEINDLILAVSTRRTSIIADRDIGIDSKTNS